MIAASVLVCLGLGELVFRNLDGFRLTAWRLVPVTVTRPAPGVARRDVAHDYLSAIPLAPGMRTEWFDLSPPPLAGRDRPDPVLNQALERAGLSGVGWEIIHVYNTNFARGADCSEPASFFRKFPGFAFLFEPPRDTPFPRYRFPRNVVSPTGLVTNRFGWRGPDIALAKPPRTIRVAFVGASTSVNDHSYPFSYPELAAFWLDHWLQQQGSDIHVEGINAGREGISSTDIAAVVRDEVLPLEPDLVVYYEGSNQFSLWDIIREPPLWKRRQSLLKRLAYIEPYSAIAQRIARLARLGANFEWLSPSGAEPPKRDYTLLWPQDVDEEDPPLVHARLPANLTTILRDLDDIESKVRSAGGEFVLSSFFWLVYDGMRLDPTRDATLYDYLNTSFAPFRYRDLERLAAFQNRVFRKFAAVRDLPFLDIAGRMPRDPNLFGDAIHATYDGVRLHAWIAAQQLAPLLWKGVGEGRLPRSRRSQRTQHPGFLQDEQTARLECKPDGKDSAHVVLSPYADRLQIPPP